MNVDLALKSFTGEAFPREAMAWALANWPTASSRFVARLRAYAAGGEQTEATDSQIFFIVHLCGQMAETRAYEPLCRMIATDPDIEACLGDAISETLPGILIKTFDGDPQPLIGAIETASADEYARGSALLALAYLVRSKGALDDDAMRAFLRRLWRGRAADALPGFWVSWAAAAAALAYTDLKVETAVLTKEELLDPGDISLEDFDQLSALSRSDPEGLLGFHDQFVQPLDDAIGTLESWEQEAEADEGEDVFEAGPEEGTYVNLLRDVGRNDPCPCGSGKKYKKCCLAA